MKKFVIIILTAIFSIGAFIIAGLSLGVISDKKTSSAEIEVLNKELSLKLNKGVLITPQLQGVFSINYNPKSYYLTIDNQTINIAKTDIVESKKTDFYEMTISAGLVVERLSEGSHVASLYAVFDGDKVKLIGEIPLQVGEDLFYIELEHEGERIFGLCSKEMLSPGEIEYSFNFVEKNTFIYPTIEFVIPFEILPSKIEFLFGNNKKEISIKDCTITKGDDCYLLKYTGQFYLSSMQKGEVETGLTVYWGNEKAIKKSQQVNVPADLFYIPGYGMDREDNWSENQ